MIQIYMHIYFFLFRFFSIKDYYKVLNTVPCAMQQGLVGYLFYLFLSFFVYLFIYSYVLSHVPLSGTPWTVAHQACLSMGFPRQEYWRGLPLPSPGDLPNPGIKPLGLTASCLGRQVRHYQRHPAGDQTGPPAWHFSHWTNREVPSSLFLLKGTSLWVRHGSL